MATDQDRSLVEQWKRPPSRTEIIVVIPGIVLLIIRLVTGT